MAPQSLSSTFPRQGVLTGSAGSGRGYDWHRLHAAAIDQRQTREPRSRALREPATRISKRMFDIAAAGTLLALLSPMFLVLAVIAKRDGGPMLFGHRRVGARGRTFKCWKFRTMVPNAEAVLARLLATDPKAREEWERDFKLRDDPRVTKIGRFLRTTSLDELPQLLNVLAGDMSLVGPRPIVQDEVRRYGAAFHDYARCRPGITGVWQISGRNDTGYGERVELDKEYARNWTFFSDLRVLLRTPAVVLRRDGAY
ncbi:sugar transferase [Niveispirillum sp. KHB5.9]|uniref:sugar transferase n=1 Tax=Niveispirillum sp. KHB5.9 TaxID=3400269 RepID=UPI003A84F2A1